LIIGPVKGDDQVVPGPRQRHIRGCDPGPEQHLVGVVAQTIAVIIRDGILARALAEPVDVGPCATRQIVVAGPSIEGVVSVIPVQSVVSGGADEVVVAVAPVKGIVACIAFEQVVAVIAV